MNKPLTFSPRLSIEFSGSKGKTSPFKLHCSISPAPLPTDSKGKDILHGDDKADIAELNEREAQVTLAKFVALLYNNGAIGEWPEGYDGDRVSVTLSTNFPRLVRALISIAFFQRGGRWERDGKSNRGMRKHGYAHDDTDLVPVSEWEICKKAIWDVVAFLRGIPQRKNARKIMAVKPDVLTPQERENVRRFFGDVLEERPERTVGVRRSGGEDYDGNGGLLGSIVSASFGR